MNNSHRQQQEFMEEYHILIYMYGFQKIRVVNVIGLICQIGLVYLLPIKIMILEVKNALFWDSNLHLVDHIVIGFKRFHDDLNNLCLIILI